MRLALSKNTNLGLMTASLLFGLIALVQLTRLVTHFSVAVGGQEVPLMANAIALAIAFYMSIWLWTLRAK